MEWNMIQAGIDLTVKEINNRFPGCSFTTQVTLWDDGTFRVESRHGTAEGKICIAGFYENELTVSVFDLYDGQIMLMDEHGNEKWFSLTPIEGQNLELCDATEAK